MKTEDIVMLINAHYEGDDKTFTRVAANIASREAINEHPEAAKKN